MANAQIETKQIVVKQDVEVVNLELSVAEAATLAIILHHVGGSPYKTTRCYADNIRQALCAAGVPAPSQTHYVEYERADISFSESSLTYVENFEL